MHLFGYQNVGHCWIMGNCVLLCDVSENKGFYYNCAEYTVVPDKNPITGFIECGYHAYFGIKLGDQNIVLGATHGM